MDGDQDRDQRQRHHLEFFTTMYDARCGRLNARWQWGRGGGVCEQRAVVRAGRETTTHHHRAIRLPHDVVGLVHNAHLRAQVRVLWYHARTQPHMRMRAPTSSRALSVSIVACCCFSRIKSRTEIILCHLIDLSLHSSRCKLQHLCPIVHYHILLVKPLRHSPRP